MGRYADQALELVGLIEEQAGRNEQATGEAFIPLSQGDLLKMHPDVSFDVPPQGLDEIHHKGISIALPGTWDEYFPAILILMEALERMKLASDYDVITDRNQPLHLVGEIEAPPLDMEILKRTIGEIGLELANPDVWKPVRSLRGPGYQCDVTHSDLLASIVSAGGEGGGGEDRNVQLILSEGTDHAVETLHELAQGEDRELPMFRRVRGAAVQRVLVEGLGIEKFRTPPEQPRRHSL